MAQISTPDFSRGDVLVQVKGRAFGSVINYVAYNAKDWEFVNAIGEVVKFAYVSEIMK